jgi:OmpA-OmpF porin, OOP family
MLAACFTGRIDRMFNQELTCRQQTTPLINKTNELDDLTAKNSKDIKDVDQRAQAGIQDVQTRAAAADQKALAAGSEADKAQMAANTASQRVDTLTNVVVNLDNYRPVVETSVHFGFNKDNLTKEAKEAIDQLAASVATTKGYIITVEGATDSVGSADYNYELSQRRADAVIQYLAAEKSVPAYKIYLIGLGKDKPVDSNKTRRRPRQEPPRRYPPDDQHRSRPRHRRRLPATRLRRPARIRRRYKLNPLVCQEFFLPLLPGGLCQTRPSHSCGRPDFFPEDSAGRPVCQGCARCARPVRENAVS